MKIFEVTENIDDQYELFVDGRPATAKLYNKKEINAVHGLPILRLKLK